MDGFFNLILEVWNQDFLGISIGNVVISLIIIVFSLILRALIISRVFKFLENLAKETETEADDILLETLEKPIGNVPLALGLYLIIELLPLSGIADSTLILRARKEYSETIVKMKQAEVLEQKADANFINIFSLNETKNVGSIKPKSIKNL